MSQKANKLTENGTLVTIEIHTAGTVSKLKDLIDSLINEWKQDNPDKRIIGEPQIIANASGLHKKAVVDSIRFTWEYVSQPYELKNRVTKEFCKTSHELIRIVLFTYDYSKMLSKAVALAKVAKKDFPSLPDDEIEIVFYSGDRRKRLMGIEFTISAATTIPADYIEVQQLEFTL